MKEFNPLDSDYYRLGSIIERYRVIIKENTDLVKKNQKLEKDKRQINEL